MIHRIHRASGFTLIEVLIALAILSISLTAIIKSTSQNIKNTLYLQNKTIAHWVGLQIMNEARAGFLKLPSAPDELHEETHMLNQTWKFNARRTPSANPHIQEIHVTVSRPPDTHPLADLTSYDYVL
jgi:general secretion pathway protein I